jgi:hypothetical protein
MTKTSLTVRLYAAVDQAACEAIFHSNVPKFFSPDESSEFKHFLAEPKAHFLVALDQDATVVGCGGCYVQGITGCLCWGMVNQELHGRSIGSCLLRERLAWLFAHPAVCEASVRTSQKSAGFFERFGFVTVKVIPEAFGSGLDEVSMKLSRARWCSQG